MGFCFDNELPRHDALLHEHCIGDRLVTNGEFAEFIKDGGYEDSNLWLSDGWAAINERGWNRPLYWSEDHQAEFTLGGLRDLDPHAPVCHVSLYEADAYARWAGARLPTEFEWEDATAELPADGNLMETNIWHPAASNNSKQFIGDVWEWTSSSYAPYPGFKPLAGSLGRVQRQVHVQSDDRARRFLRHSQRSYSCELSQLLLSRRALAVSRHSPGEGRRGMSVTEILHGLRQDEKMISPKYFYDERGSQLFDEITTLPEYYPTETELGIMRDNIAEIADLIGPQASLIEYGSGSSRKTRVLLEHLIDQAVYVPVDISEEHLLVSAHQIRSEFPGLEVLPVVADFTKRFDLPHPQVMPLRNIVYFPGSTIGNFTHDAACELLEVMYHEAGEDGAMLIGVDLQKDPNIIEQAYNDSAGVTAEFNLNMLRHINREYGTDFDLNSWEHDAQYNSSQGRVEIRLINRESADRARGWQQSCH